MVPITNPTMYIQGMASQPIHQARGTVARISPIIDSPTTYTGSLRTRSSQTPPGSEKRTNGAISIAVSKPIWVGLAFNNTAAVKGSASMVICAPKALVRMEVHSRR